MTDMPQDRDRTPATSDLVPEHSTLSVDATVGLGEGERESIGPYRILQKIGEGGFDILDTGSIDLNHPAFDVAFMPGLTEGRFMQVQYGGATELGLDGAATADAVGHFHDDEHLDIAVSISGSPGSVLVLFNESDGSFSSTQQVNVGNEPSAIVVDDSTGNGRDDIAVTNQAPVAM